MQETRHNAGAARYLYGTPQGILEFRSIPTPAETINALILHAVDCDAEDCDTDLCDAEYLDGANIALSWAAGDDAGVWYELSLYAVGREVADTQQMPHEPSADERALLGRLRAEGQRMVGEGHFHNGQEH
ncbi:hypothetical protein O7626_40315 [Micromonospora sp. WMMD1102]|uniref:hypothetical protein n=1 Tax=Micromonospora sp. WMMD1102 TaxID=3016105 RepID=UPI00241547AD|nr:hypothetical protein [Micromonospora sp. WMMD1102]MDG4792063.1 hypothetical protein [Micromonospora sp. WMMD1102]